MNYPEMKRLRQLAAGWQASRWNAKAGRELAAVLDEIAAADDNGPHLFTIRAYGATVPDISAEALAEARVLYGGKAELLVEHVGQVDAERRHSRGRFSAHVLVRCLNYPPEEDSRG